MVLSYNCFFFFLTGNIGVVMSIGHIFFLFVCVCVPYCTDSKVGTGQDSAIITYRFKIKHGC